MMNVRDHTSELARTACCGWTRRQQRNHRMLLRPSFALLLLARIAHGCSGPRTPGDLRSALWADNPHYQKDTRPGVALAAESDQPWAAPADNVTFNLGVPSPSVVSVSTGTFTVEMTATISWIDTRLRFNTSGAGGCFAPDGPSGPTPVSFEGSILHEIWAPEPNFETSSVINPKDGAVLAEGVKLYSNGKVVWVQRSRRTFDCLYDLSKMPFDVHACEIRIQPWGRPTTEINYRAGFAFTAEQIGGAVEWSLGHEVAIKESVTFTNEAVVSFVVTLKRRYWYYVLNVMMPTGLFVLVVWASFFIARAAVPARTAMTVTSMLIIINFQSSVLRSLPAIATPTYLLNYVRASMFFSMYGILEFVVVNMITRREAKVDAALNALHKKCEADAKTDAERADDLSSPPRSSTERLGRGCSEGQVRVVVEGDEECRRRERVAVASRAAGRCCGVLVDGRSGGLRIRDELPDLVSRWLFLPMFAIVQVALYPWG